MLIVECFYTRAGSFMKSALFLFCVKMSNWLIINVTCLVRENFAKNTVKNISKTLQV